MFIFISVVQSLSGVPCCSLGCGAVWSVSECVGAGVWGGGGGGAAPGSPRLPLGVVTELSGSARHGERLGAAGAGAGQHSAGPARHW